MLRIAICDDTQTELEQISALTNEYVATHNLVADVRAFSHPDELLTVCETETFHIFLLDMVMPMINGLELGRSIRRIDTDAQIIYITTEPGYALDAYAIHPLHYLLKPVNKQALLAALDLAGEKARVENVTVTIKTRDGLRTFFADSVAYCEYMRHNVIYTLLSGERVETTTISGSFADHIAPLLRNRRFIRPHAAYAVNMSRVERLSKEGFLLQGGTFISVSGKQYAAVRNAYMNYRLGEV